MEDGKRWRTSTVVDMCQEIRGSQNYSLMPILADALMDASYDDDSVLTLCREPEIDEIVASKIISLIFSDETAESVRWIETFAIQIEQDYSMLMEAARTWVFEKEYTSVGDNMGFYEGSEQQWDDFWRHFENVFAVTVEDKEPSFFRCAC